MSDENRIAASRAEKARELYLEGYNCAQAVALAFADLTGTDVETVKLASAPFGGGMGRLGEVCGAVSGMLMTLSFVRRRDTLDAREKAALYNEERVIAERFRTRAGSILCRDLLMMRAGKKEGGGLACPDIVALAAEIIENEVIAVSHSENKQ